MMIGDNLETDIAFGNKSGLRHTLLVETGVHALHDVEALRADPTKQVFVPTLVIPALSLFAELL